MKLTTKPLNFTPTPFLLERIQTAARGNREAMLDLLMQNIGYDEERGGWLKLPDYQQNFALGDHDRHNARIWNGQSGYSDYGIWHLAFTNILLADDLWQELPHGHLDPYGFVMKLYDNDFTPQEAAEIFVRADAKKLARQMEALEVAR